MSNLYQGIEQMSEMSWLKITIKSDPQLLEPISDFLVGVLGAAVESTAIDEPGYGTLNCYIEEPNPEPAMVEENLKKITAYLSELSDIFQTGKPSLSHELIGDQDWGKNWKRFFKPLHILEDLVIVPTWEEYHHQPGESTIIMDPGMAFGTGHHSTTSLCLEAIRETLGTRKIQTVLDVGTGTGILAMAAIHYGAVKAIGIDNDTQAVAAAIDNVEINGMGNVIEISDTPIHSLSDQYDLVVANIVHDVLLDLAESLTQATSDGGTLIVSGVLAGEQSTNIEERFAQKGFHVVHTSTRKEWAAVQLRKLEK